MSLEPTGETAKNMVADIQAAGGIITMEDLANYRVQWEEPTTHKLKNLGYTLISSPPPGSGAILSSILGVRSEIVAVILYVRLDYSTHLKEYVLIFKRWYFMG